MSTSQRRQLRVLIAGQRDSFSDVLATNVQRLGYEVIMLSAESKGSSTNGYDVEGDILLYDVDELLQRHDVGNPPSLLEQGVQTADSLEDWESLPCARLTIVLSSCSVSRAMLERMGAIALLHKPFNMAQLQRYLCVLQRLLLPEQEQGRQMAIDTYERAIRVLVVDDDKGVAGIISECLSAEPDFAVAVAHNGLEALELSVDWHPQCIVTDLIMPWMDGYQMIHCLSASMLRAMPAFVVMSALTRLEGPRDRAYLRERGITYVDKPFRIDHLLSAIKQVCAVEHKKNLHSIERHCV